MSQFQIYQQQNMDFTLISNAFIDRFLTEANDAQIKVYLYLLRHKNNVPKCSISAITDCFNYSEKDVLRALSYWEKKELLKLSFAENGELNGILLCNVPSADSSQTRDTLFQKPSEPVVPVMSQQGFSQRSPVSVRIPEKTTKKPDYSLDQLAQFQAKESTAELIFIAESYLGRTLNANDLRSIFFISDELHFSFDLMDYLLQYCIERGKRDFRYIEKVAISWAEAQISTPAEAQSYTVKYDKDTYVVMNALGKNHQPTPREAEFIKRWYQIYGFTAEVILEACERTVMATDKHRFEYADKILSSWKNQGVRHKTDIARADTAYHAAKKNAAAAPPKNKFNQFQQNDYDFAALEKELLSN